jgi:hypothetical protein
MATAKVLSSPEKLTLEKDRPLSNFWPWLVAGPALTCAAWLVVVFFQESLTALRVVLVFAGVLAALVAVAIKPSSVRVLLGAALTAGLGAMALYVSTVQESWDSIRWFLKVAAVVSLLAAQIVALPRLEGRAALAVIGVGLLVGIGGWAIFFVRIEDESWRSIRWYLAAGSVWGLVTAGLVALPRLARRRAALSGIILLHFGAILTAVLGQQPGPWLAGMVWTEVSGRYLQHMYLINAYHFYAPNPGPSYFLWFWVSYTKEGDRKNVYWKLIKVPDIDDETGWPRYPLALQYQRRLAMANLLSQAAQGASAARAAELNRNHERANLERAKRGEPIFPLVSNRVAYLEPSPFAKVILQSYVRHVAKKFAAEHPGASITGIKMYRVEHIILDAPDLAHGEEPRDPYTYVPHFWGDFDTAGQLKNPNDPFLYWLMPVLRVKPGQSVLFPSNEEIIRPLAEHLHAWLREYQADEARNMPLLPPEVTREAGVSEDFSRLLERFPVTPDELKAFEKKYPQLAGKTNELLKENRKKQEMLDDIKARVNRPHRLPDDVKLLALVEDMSFLLGKYPKLIDVLILHRRDAFVKGDKAAVAQIMELGRLQEIWSRGRFRLSRDDEDHFDLAVFEATNVPGRSSMVLNYAYFHAGDPNWVCYPGVAEWQAVKPEMMGARPE